MGCGTSKVNEILDPEFRAMGLLDGEVQLLHAQFYKFDKSYSGSVSIEYVRIMLGVDTSDCINRIFKLFGDHSINFKQFVFAVWIILVPSPKAFCLLVFELYDVQRKGYFLTEEFLNMLCFLQERNNCRDKMISTLAEFPGGEDLHDHGKKKYDLDCYEKFMVSRVGLILPLVQHQTRLRNRLGGNAKWEKVGERLMAGTTTPITIFIEESAKKYLKQSLTQQQKRWPVACLGVVQTSYLKYISTTSISGEDSSGNPVGATSPLSPSPAGSPTRLAAGADSIVALQLAPDVPTSSTSQPQPGAQQARRRSRDQDINTGARPAGLLRIPSATQVVEQSRTPVEFARRSSIGHVDQRMMIELDKAKRATAKRHDPRRRQSF